MDYLGFLHSIKLNKQLIEKIKMDYHNQKKDKKKKYFFYCNDLIFKGVQSKVS